MYYRSVTAETGTSYSRKWKPRYRRGTAAQQKRSQVRDANQAKKQRKQAVEERKLKNGLTLTVDVKPPVKNDADMISC